MALRRSCVLDVARRLIAEVGVGAVSMRLLAERSGVAYSTLYNIYGNRETLIAAAVGELFAKQLREADAYIGEGIDGALDGAMIRLDWFAREILGMPEYARAMVSVFFSGSANRVRDLLRSLSSGSYRRLLARVAEQGGIAAWADMDLVADELSVREFAVVQEWAIGRIPDGQLAQRQKYALLLTIGGVARDAALDAIHRHMDACQARLFGRRRDRTPAPAHGR